MWEGMSSWKVPGQTRHVGSGAIGAGHGRACRDLVQAGMG